MVQMDTLNSIHLPGTDGPSNPRIVDAATPLPKRTATRRNPTEAGVGAILGGVRDESIPLQILELLEAQLVPTVGVVATLPKRARDVLQVVQAQLGLDLVLTAGIALEVLRRWRYGGIPIGLARSDEPIIVGTIIVACIGRFVLVGNVGQNGQGRYDAAPAATVTADTRHDCGDFGSCTTSSKGGTCISGSSSACGGFIIVNTTDTAEKALTTTTTWSCTLIAQEEGVAVGWCGGHGGRSGHWRRYRCIVAAVGGSSILILLILLDGGEPLQLAGGCGGGGSCRCGTVAGGAAGADIGGTRRVQRGLRRQLEGGNLVGLVGRPDIRLGSCIIAVGCIATEGQRRNDRHGPVAQTVPSRLHTGTARQAGGRMNGGVAAAVAGAATEQNSGAAGAVGWNGTCSTTSIPFAATDDDVATGTSATDDAILEAAAATPTERNGGGYQLLLPLLLLVWVMMTTPSSAADSSWYDGVGAAADAEAGGDSRVGSGRGSSTGGLDLERRRQEEGSVVFCATAAAAAAAAAGYMYIAIVLGGIRECWPRR